MTKIYLRGVSVIGSEYISIFSEPWNVQKFSFPVFKMVEMCLSWNSFDYGVH